jgi:hypothetical protein
VRPFFDLRAEPEHAAAAAEGDYRARHVGIPTLIQAHVPGLRETEDLGDITSVNKVLGVDEWRHGGERICGSGSVRRDP